jgi:hypothetical protein
LAHTKNLISDLDRQTHSKYDVYFYDQNSTEPGTKEFLIQLSRRSNYHVIQNGENIPLNHVWNKFANTAKDYDILTFLNNDIRITSNYLQDTANVLGKDPRIGIVIHATNNRDFSTATSPTRHIFQEATIKQGWEFSLRPADWKDIPHQLWFYCGDDFIFDNMHKMRKKVGVVTSSPVIHKLSKTREAMGEDFTAKIKQRALIDIENYKKLGFNHQWNNITKYSRLQPELKQITEVSTEINLCKFNEYRIRLSQHLDDIKNVDGDILDIGVSDPQTFIVLLDTAMEQNKKVIGIDSTENLSGDIVSNVSKNRAAERIKNSPNLKPKQDHFCIIGNNFLTDMNQLNVNASFIFVGIFNPIKLRAILPKIWETINDGGTIFFPYYHYETCDECAEIIDEFFANKKSKIYCSRMQTKKGVRDTYLAIKALKNSVPYINRGQRPLVIASVLKTGGIYDDRYVNRLASAVKRHITHEIDYTFACLTDSTEGNIDLSLVDQIIPLQYNLSGWWSKLELFRPELFNGAQILYFDLDTLIVNNIDDFASYGGDFLCLRDFNTLTHIGSGILSWNAKKCHHIFYKFFRELISGDIQINQFLGGDQEAIEHFLEIDPQWVQDVFPNKMAAFKYQCYDSATKEVNIPELSSVICFHSKPKMADLKHDPIIKRHWK